MIEKLVSTFLREGISQNLASLEKHNQTKPPEKNMTFPQIQNVYQISIRDFNFQSFFFLVTIHKALVVGIETCSPFPPSIF